MKNILRNIKHLLHKKNYFLFNGEKIPNCIKADEIDICLSRINTDFYYHAQSLFLTSEAISNVDTEYCCNTFNIKEMFCCVNILKTAEPKQLEALLILTNLLKSEEVFSEYKFFSLYPKNVEHPYCYYVIHSNGDVVSNSGGFNGTKPKKFLYSQITNPKDFDKIKHSIKIEFDKNYK